MDLLRAEANGKWRSNYGAAKKFLSAVSCLVSTVLSQFAAQFELVYSVRTTYLIVYSSEVVKERRAKVKGRATPRARTTEEEVRLAGRGKGQSLLYLSLVPWELLLSAIALARIEACKLPLTQL